jgi:hypothetical protein
VYHQDAGASIVCERDGIVQRTVRLDHLSLVITDRLLGRRAGGMSALWLLKLGTGIDIAELGPNAERVVGTASSTEGWFSPTYRQKEQVDAWRATSVSCTDELVFALSFKASSALKS